MCWINLDDQMPDDSNPKQQGVLVDVFGWDEQLKTHYRVPDVIYRDGKFTEWRGLISRDVSDFLKITHWRYPPAPPIGSVA